MPISDPLASPIHAPEFLLAKLPPMLLVVGSAEPLVGENVYFAQKLQKIGARAVVEVWQGMWHDFIQVSWWCTLVLRCLPRL